MNADADIRFDEGKRDITSGEIAKLKELHDRFTEERQGELREERRRFMYKIASLALKLFGSKDTLNADVLSGVSAHLEKNYGKPAAAAPEKPAAVETRKKQPGYGFESSSSGTAGAGRKQNVERRYSSSSSGDSNSDGDSDGDDDLYRTRVYRMRSSRLASSLDGDDPSGDDNGVLASRFDEYIKSATQARYEAMVSVKGSIANFLSSFLRQWMPEVLYDEGSANAMIQDLISCPVLSRYELQWPVSAENLDEDGDSLPSRRPRRRGGRY